MSITSTSTRSRPLRSSPLAGPAVVGEHQRPVSAHSPLRPKSHSFQDSPARPVSLYHRKRPSTAPGPAIPHDEHAVFNDEHGLLPNPHVRYSSSLLLAVPSSNDDNAPLKSPKPILKHRTSQNPPSSPSSLSFSSVTSASASSTDDVRFSAADKGKGKMSPSDESWYTFSPYATTPKFSRLGLASAGVVMPVSAKELARSKSSASKASARRQSGRVASPNVNEHRSLLHTRPDQQQAHAARFRPQAQQQPRSQIPAAPASATSSAWLNVPPPARTHFGKSAARGSTAASSSPSPVDVSGTGSSSRSSTSTRRTSTTTSVNSAASSSTSLPSAASYQHLPQTQAPTATEKGKGKREKRKSLSLSLGLKSWRSIRVAPPASTAQGADEVQEQGTTTAAPLPTPPLAAHFADSPDSPSPDDIISPSPNPNPAASAVPPAPSSASLPPAPLSHEPSTPPPVSSTTALQDHPSTSPTAPPQQSHPQPQSHDASTPAAAPVYKLKKRKSASAILARVKSWRWGAGAGAGASVVGTGGRGGRGVDVDAGVGASVESGVGADGVRDEGGVVDVGREREGSADAPARVVVPVVVVEGEGERRVDMDEEVQVQVQVQSKPVMETDTPEAEVVRDDHTNAIIAAEATIPLELQHKHEHDVVSATQPPPSSSASSPCLPLSVSPNPSTTTTPNPMQLSIPIPSPNLHVSSETVPGYIQSQITLHAQAQAQEQVKKEKEKEVVEREHHASRDVIDDNVVEESGKEKEDAAAPRAGDGGVHETSASVGSSGVSKSETDGDSEFFPSASASSAPAPVSAINIAPSAPLPTLPSTLPSPVESTALIKSTAVSQDRSRSQTRSHRRSPSQSLNLNKPRARSGSVRRLWSALVCGAGSEDAEKMAAEAWAEVQAEHRVDGAIGRGRGKDVDFDGDLKGREAHNGVAAAVAA